MKPSVCNFRPPLLDQRLVYLVLRRSDLILCSTILTCLAPPQLLPDSLNILSNLLKLYPSRRLGEIRVDIVVYMLTREVRGKSDRACCNMRPRAIDTIISAAQSGDSSKTSNR